MDVFLKMKCGSWRTSLLTIKAVAEMFPISAISNSLSFTSRSLTDASCVGEVMLFILAPAGDNFLTCILAYACSSSCLVAALTFLSPPGVICQARCSSGAPCLKGQSCGG